MLIRKPLLIVTAVLLMAACKAPTKPKQTLQEKAEETIKNYQSENLGDPKSYEPVSFTPIDSIRESNQSGEYVNFIRHGVLPPDTTNKHGFFGYVTSHEYRFNNKTGGKELTHNIFYLSKDLNRVILKN